MVSHSSFNLWSCSDTLCWLASFFVLDIKDRLALGDRVATEDRLAIEEKLAMEERPVDSLLSY